MNTSELFDQQIEICRQVFLKKNQDYGTSWRIMRPSSITDQLFIKAQRIQTLEKLKKQMVGEGIETEFIGIVNYAIMGLLQLQLINDTRTDIPLDELIGLYDNQVANIKSLMLAKNHDYGEAWRDMRITSFTDLILMKLLRIKQMENNECKPLFSEGIDAGYCDIVNYAIFALIKLQESSKENFTKK
jgi:hypothetical protein